MSATPSTGPGKPKSPQAGGWYGYKSGQCHGPFTPDQILDQLRLGKLAWVDYVWNASQGLVWRMACEIPIFRSALPKPPSTDVLRKLMAASGQSGVKEASEAGKIMVWFLQFEGTEFGPLATDEVNQILKAGKLKGELFARREGESEWQPVGQIPELGGKPERRSGDDRRRARRVTVVATAVFSPIGTHPGSAPLARFMGVCRDISTSGVLIMSSMVPGGIGSRVKLEIQSAPTSLLPSFACEAEIRRILSNGQGFAVEFRGVSADQQAKLDDYIQKTQDL